MAVQQEILVQVHEQIEKSDGLILDLSHIRPMSPETTQHVIRAIAERLNNLTSLDLADNQIGEAGARVIAELITNLTSLNLAGSQCYSSMR